MGSIDDAIALLNKLIRNNKERATIQALVDAAKRSEGTVRQLDRMRDELALSKKALDAQMAYGKRQRCVADAAIGSANYFKDESDARRDELARLRVQPLRCDVLRVPFYDALRATIARLYHPDNATPGPYRSAVRLLDETNEREGDGWRYIVGVAFNEGRRSAPPVMILNGDDGSERDEPEPFRVTVATSRRSGKDAQATQIIADRVMAAGGNAVISTVSMDDPAGCAVEPELDRTAHGCATAATDDAGWPDAEPEKDRLPAMRADGLERVLDSKIDKLQAMRSSDLEQRLNDMAREIAVLQATRANERGIAVAMDLIAERLAKLEHDAKPGDWVEDGPRRQPPRYSESIKAGEVKIGEWVKFVGGGVPWRRRATSGLGVLFFGAEGGTRVLNEDDPVLVQPRVNVKTSKAPEEDAPARQGPSSTPAETSDGISKPWLADNRCAEADEQTRQ